MTAKASKNSSESTPEGRWRNLVHEVKESTRDWPTAKIDVDVRLVDDDLYIAYVRNVPAARVKASATPSKELSFTKGSPLVLSVSADDACKGLKASLNTPLAAILGKLLGDSVALRLFAHDALAALSQLKPGSKRQVLRTPNEIRNAARNLAIAAEKTACLMRSNLHSEVKFISNDVQRLATSMRQPRRVTIDGPVVKKESVTAWRARTSVADWPALIESLTFLASSLKDMGAPQASQRGRAPNRRHNYTTICMLADAWLRNFDDEPSGSDKATFFRAANACLIYCKQPSVDVRAGLSYWKKNWRGRKRGPAQHLLNPVVVDPFVKTSVR